MRLQHRIQLQKLDDPTSAGQVPEDWVVYRNCYAKVDEGGGSETSRGAQQIATATVRLTIRYPQEGRVPSPTDRVVLIQRGQTRILHIAAVERQDDRMRWLVLACDEVLC